ncbi:PIG-U-domain-containing protein [Patellaria atrata CBS 101060]|uniref:PIG-U-domain-containing protein n=1 Tax=Patellaria atrata CBS 101060 TaxID=1346257 RepID=A0A9P4S898_9PEZI|nr:PIG-U-domain-containing protein [Patellaria atrata CBS 101060]
MAVDKQRALLFGGAAALRLLLFIAFPSLPDFLTGRVEISTPVTSFKRLQEGLFLYTRDVSPYDGGIFHQAPLLLPLFSFLPDPSTYPFATNLLYTVIDLLSANALLQIADTGISVSNLRFTSSRKELRWSSILIAATFLFNPFTVLTCIARPTSVFTNSAVFYAVAKAAAGFHISALISLAVASYLSLYPILLLPPLLLLAQDGLSRRKAQPVNTSSFVMNSVTTFSVACFSLLGISYLITDSSWEFISSTYGVQLLLPDLTPNVGLWWYFFIEMFDSFREFFLGVFWLHMASYMGGLTFRIHKQPLFAIICLLGIFAIFQPYPSIADTSLYLALLPLYRHVFPLMRYTFFAFATLLYASFLGPAFYYLWIYAGSGNANFFYAITLVWSLGLSVIVADSLYAVLRDEWEVERPEMKGKEVRQI